MPDTRPVKYLPIKEFVDEGYLQEANRRFFHPLGIALEVNEGFKDRKDVQEWLAERGIQFGDDAVDCVWTFISAARLDGYFISGVWDDRENPEGDVFHESIDLVPKAINVQRLIDERSPVRQQMLGYVVQPATPPGES